jgi:phosphotransferase system IIB component
LVSSIVILGASPATVTALVTALSGLQTGGIVNINNVNAAITALTQLLNESSPEALAALANDPNFRAVVNLLRELRVAVGQS